MSHWLTRICA